MKSGTSDSGILQTEPVFGMVIRNHGSGTLGSVREGRKGVNRTMSVAPTDHRRSDARANRVRVLEAARACFADDLDAQMQDVAKRAGVGVGTVYRHFENKQALQRALAVFALETTLACAREGLAIDDPWEGFEHFVRGASALLAQDALTVEALVEGFQSTEVDAAKAEMRAASVQLAARAQAAGVMRDDVSPEQVDRMLCHTGQAMRGADRTGFDWRAYIEVVLDGLRR
jgi:AcrR family transcriptional regulator